MLANRPDPRLRMRSPAPGPRGGGLYLSELQRTRLLDAAFAIVAERGYRGMAVRAVSERAGVSSKTFYDLFSDREDCFLQAFDYGLDRLVPVVLPAFEAEGEWAAGVRAGLGAMLAFLDGEPELRVLVFVEALGVGPRVLVRRAQVLDELAALIDQGRAGAKAGGELPPLTADGLVGAAFSVVHARLVQEGSGSLTALLNPLMATVVLPYRGRAAAARELEHPAGRAARYIRLGDRSRKGGRSAGSGSSADFRLTVRRHMALTAVAELCAKGLDPSNREVAERVGVADEGQVSRLMMNLQAQGLLLDTRAGTSGNRKAWRLTSRGEALLQANRPLGERAS
jgi:AcrR family transcriptional regulator